MHVRVHVYIRACVHAWADTCKHVHIPAHACMLLARNGQEVCDGITSMPRLASPRSCRFGGPHAVMFTFESVTRVCPCNRPPQKDSMWVAIGGVVRKVTCNVSEQLFFDYSTLNHCLRSYRYPEKMPDNREDQRNRTNVSPLNLDRLSARGEASALSIGRLLSPVCTVQFQDPHTFQFVRAADVAIATAIRNSVEADKLPNRSLTP